MDACTPFSPKKCLLDIIVEGESQYEVILKTGEAEGCGTTSPISFSINGDKGEGQTTILTESGVKEASRERYVVLSNDVGNITGFTLGLENKAKYLPFSVKITDLSI